MSGSLGNIKAETAKAISIAQVKKAHLRQRFVKLPANGRDRQGARRALVAVYSFGAKIYGDGRW